MRLGRTGVTGPLTAAACTPPGSPHSVGSHSSFEEILKIVDLGITEEMAIKEARRCLRCDLQTEDAKKQLEDAQLVTAATSDE